MSSYIHFFVRKGNEFAPIGTYGRSTFVYSAFEVDAPWEHIAAVDIKTLDRAKNRLLNIGNLRSDIAAADETIGRIEAFNNSIAEKMEAIARIKDEIKEMNETIEDVLSARHFIGFLYDILDEAEYSSQLNANEYLYVGMECGSDVSVKDIMAKKI